MTDLTTLTKELIEKRKAATLGPWEAELVTVKMPLAPSRRSIDQQWCDDTFVCFAANHAAEIAEWHLKLFNTLKIFFRRYDSEFGDETQGAAETLGKIDMHMDELRAALGDVN